MSAVARRLVCALSLAFLLAGCQTVPKNPLDATTIRSFRLDGVAVGFAPDATIVWGASERLYAKAKDITWEQAGKDIKSAEGRAFVEDLVAAKLRDAIQTELGGELVGARPVRIEVMVHRLFLPSAIERILIGGNNFINAPFSIVDAETGEVLVARADFKETAMAGQGIIQVTVEQMMPDPIDRMAKDYAQNLRRWLLPK